MVKRLICITLVLLLVASVASAGRRNRYSSSDIKQKQSTSLYVSGGTSGWGGTAATSGGSVYANQSAYKGWGKAAQQTAGSSIGSSSSSFWGSVYTWFSGWANTWQEQSVD